MKRKKHLYRILSCLLVFAIFFASMPLTPPSIFAEGIEDTVAMSAGNTTEFAGGTGVEGDPYLIATKEHLNNVRRYLDAYFKMTDDIEFNENEGADWEPIGKKVDVIGRIYISTFRGTFDGDNHIIRGLKIIGIGHFENTSKSAVYAGLFADNEGTILNLGMVDCSVESTFQGPFAGNVADYVYAGGVVGCNSGRIENCYNTGNVSADSGFYVVAGGIAGRNTGEISSCYNTGSVDAVAYSSRSSSAGGIAGNNSFFAVISNCYNTGSVSASMSSPSSSYYDDDTVAGGIAGHNSGDISNCNNTGKVSASDYTGGIAGYNSGDISNCNNAGKVSASDYTGGIAGYNSGNSGTISDCHNTGSVNGRDNTGGIAGRNTGEISSCYNTGSVDARSYSYHSSFAGGIAGYNEENEFDDYGRGGVISNCYNTGSVAVFNSSSTDYSGGIVGCNSRDVSDCYNAGSVSFLSNVEAGGIAGENSGNIGSCYYLNRISKGCGSGSTTGAIMCTEEELRLQKTFVGFDFDSVWTMDGDEIYPYPELCDVEYIRAENTSEFAGGTGLPFDPYLISNKEQLDNVRSYFGAYFKMTADIVFTEADFAEGGAFYNGGEGWIPIGTYENVSFIGTFDGDNHTIKGLKITIEDPEITVSSGLFGYNKGAVLNLGVLDESVNVSSLKTKSYAGGIAGYNSGSISNCYNTGRVSDFSVSSSAYVGGIVGYNSYGEISECYNTGSVSAFPVSSSACVGGIVGYNSYGEISECYNTGSLSAFLSSSVDIGGIAGNNSSGTISDCYNAGNVSASSNSTESSYSDAGGIAGSNVGDISNCYNTGSVSSSSNSSSSYDDCYAGGIAGYNSEDISNCYNTGSVSSSSNSSSSYNYCYAGGIAGGNGGDIRNCYNTGSVSGNVYVGAIAGENSGYTFYCYYLDNILEGYGYGSTDGTFKCTEEELRLQQTFVGFDFDSVWTMDGNEVYPYPELQAAEHIIIEEKEENTSEFAGGTGLYDNPYLIATKEHLNNVRNYLDAYFKMTDDIVFTEADFAEGGAFYNDGKGWKPIGIDKDTPFFGMFDGDNHTIKGLKITIKDSESEVYAGLFGYNKGSILNLGMLDGSISTTGTAGGIAGFNSGTISDCYNTGSLSASSSSSYNYDADVGGIAGYNNSGIIKDCYNTGNVNGSTAGGIAGYNSDGEISECYNTGSVSASSESPYYYSCAGGIAGYNDSGIIKDCYNTGSLSALQSRNHCAGGIAGGNGGDISNCYNTGSVSGSFLGSFGARSDAYAGGVVGKNDSLGEISDCYNTGSVSDSSSYIANTGGIAGVNYGEISNCYNTGRVSAYNPLSSPDSYAGGIVGFNSGNEYLGYGIIENCYYLDNISKGCGYGSTDGTFRRTEEELRQQKTFSGFVFGSVWTMGGDKIYPYPELRAVEFKRIENTFEFAGGTGATYDPYLISTKEHLNNVRNYLGAYFKMTADIVFTEADFAEGGDYYNDGKGWMPIGTDGGTPFFGTFDGDNHTIKGLKISIKDSQGIGYVGLFGYNKGTILNLGILDGEVSAASDSADLNAGGIAGYNSGDIKNCYNTGGVSVSSTSSESVNVYVGGIAGYNDSFGDISNCYNAGTVSAESGSAGGIAGYNSGDIRNCYNTGSVSGDCSPGGIVGCNQYGKISKCYNTGSVSGNGDFGGIVGENSGEIYNCYYLDNISIGCGSGPTHGTLKCTEKELRQQKTFSGFDFDSVWTMDGDENYPYPELRNMPIPAPSYSHGDLDGDGIVDANDVYYLLQYTFYPDLYQLNQDCDFNKDGDVNADDVYYLLQYTFYPELYPLN